ncbi:sodium-dependent transporter [Motilimonas sp. 1_MG-2023]|uniref:sodium-dependent transporter n=1 Tax=Motilimonas TaxID=1914248 RepID=UPI0026E383D8|nr:sodium-dependent transporter [Motilimonas sp. 1_MG-2023]MDO6527371.1 sodium-dependent transporter [Motilimonas sp. 1_MG-2023]
MAQTRGQFSSRLGFVLAAAGCAVGVGNIWGFPTQAASNGGGAFLLVYLVLIFMLGYPMLVAELLIGRAGQANPMKSMQSVASSPLTRHIGATAGIVSILVVTLIFTFYSIISGWFISFTLAPVVELAGDREKSVWLTDFSLSRNLVFTTLFGLITILVVKKGIKDGIEKWSTRLMPLLFLLLIASAMYMMTQNGAMEGLKAYLLPDFSQVFDATLLANALGQTFFSLSLGSGAMMVYGSYLSKQDSVPKLAAQVTLVDTGVAFLAGLLIVPAMYVAMSQGVEIFDANGDLIASSNLVFKVLPALFDTMGSAKYIVSTGFFFLLVIAALTSSIAMLETPVAFVCELTRIDRSKAVWIVGLTAISFSNLIVFNFDMLFELIIQISTQYAQPLASLAVCIFAGWVWHRNKVLAEIRQGDDNIENSLFWKIWPAYVKFVCPVLVGLLVVRSITA